jgi:Delta7-sterol 5-desaturase
MMEIAVTTLIKALAMFAIFAVGSYLLLWRIFPEFAKARKIQPGNVDSRNFSRELRTSIWQFAALVLASCVLGYPAIFQSTKLYLRADQYGWEWYIASYFVTVLFHDAYFYWSHRFMHHRYVFKYIHYEHHKTIDPTPLTIYSFHPIEAFIQVFWVFPYAYLVPVSVEILAVVGAQAVITNTLGHLGVELFPIKWWRKGALKWVNTPTHHSHHHLYVNGNFGHYTLMWDRLMGTEKMETKNTIYKVSEGK